MKRVLLAAAAAAGVVLCFPGVARAQVESARHAADGSHYKFLDELLNSDVRGPSGGRITVRPPAMRSLLIRPRTNFVPEMLKSVENM